MFKVPVESLHDYFNFDLLRKHDLLRLDRLIRTAAPELNRYFHAGTPAGQPGMRFKMIGYGRFSYPAKKGQHVEWPVIGVALQKNYISVYMAVCRKRTPLVRLYGEELNCLRFGQNNFSFEKFDDLNEESLRALFAEAAAIFACDPENPARYMSGTL